MVVGLQSMKGEAQLLRLTIRPVAVDPGMAGSIEDEMLLASCEQQRQGSIFALEGSL